MSKGKEKLIQQFLVDGMTYMFGNPGTVEQGFLDAIQDFAEFRYITCLQESIAVAMADGYARKAKKPAIVQLHSGVGLGNGIGMLYQAFRGHSPLIVIAGEAGVRYDAMDAQMACDLVDMSSTVTKWSGRVTHSASLLRTVRKAVKIAMTPPFGPVFISLPMDILDEENFEDVMPSVMLRTNAVADKGTITEIADVLLSAQNPLFIIGDGIAYSNAKNEIEELAKLIGAKVWGADYSEVNFDTGSPLYMGQLGHMFGESSQKKVKDADVVFISGTYVFPEVFPCIKDVFNKRTKIIHIDLNTYEIAKNFTVDIGVAAHPKSTIQGINEEIKHKLTFEHKKKVDLRYGLLTKSKAADISDLDDGSMASEFMKCLSRSISAKTIIFDEALTVSPYLNYYFTQSEEGRFFQTRGGSLGVGIPGAMGIKLASAKDIVLVFTGDGGSMYTIQALHTAARYGIDIKIIILNNKGYQLLKNNIDVYWSERNIHKHSYPNCFDLTPSIDFVSLAKSMGILDGVKIENVSEIEDGVSKLLSSKGTFIIELVI